MPNRIALTHLNASTVDIINTIRANASYQYQNLVPEIGQATDIPKVGEVLFGYPALANEFVNSLVNRIALVDIKSAMFNNPLAELKKGYLEYGETVEECFVEMQKAVRYNADTAYQDEFKRNLPDVKTAFHVCNWKVRYPVTIQRQELQRAFLSEQGMTELIDKIRNSIVEAANYDEYLIEKFLLIKGVTHGKIKAIGFDGAEQKNAAKALRGTANLLPFPSKEYNEAGVLATTPKDKLHIFMSAQYNADFDVDVLSAAFNMDKAEFIGKLHIIDDFTTFDNERFAAIMAESDGLEAVTEEELALMADVKAILASSDWFQIYDNLTQFTEVAVTTGLYWNYNLHVWKTFSHSPFAEICAFVDGEGAADPETLTAEVVSADLYEGGKILTFNVDADNADLSNRRYKFIQTEAATQAGIAVLPMGGMIIPASVTTLTPTMVHIDLGGKIYTINSTLAVADAAPGTEITLEP